ncbi:PEP-CTERM sorting domain-containing protein [Brevifollis gellanilyticus]|uniref:PEP-CTERM protein-sorting domain-containing protein n=1 Tax=Brevifollis gellanilyticus TaxID=748831 RepID=A0A512MGQ4_9BACT|nr:PEP-CTERM sorting domain-containing protein [Brevifollis gellanilyticus]GEP45904.1 hypothetical protein BGE01nite_51950 [Brevifollis gellanilyticus]
MCFRQPPQQALSCRFSQVLALCLLMVTSSQAVVLYDTDNALANTTAPTGIYQDSGWAYEGKFGSFLGTMIGDQYFITARHVGPQGSSFVSTADFNGVADINYTIDSSANGGAGFWDIAGTDLRVFKINETFSTWAPLYTGNLELGSTLVTFGRGGPRGAEVVTDDPGPPVADVLHGWRTTGADGVARWGANVVSGIVSSNVGSLLSAEFNAASGINEATLSPGDSGGGVFIQVAGQWYLAGVNYAVDGLFDTNNTIDALEFEAALFDMGGFYVGNDTDGWNFVNNTIVDVPSHMYASRISTNSAAILAVMNPVPEPGSCALVMLAGFMALRRRRSLKSSLVA